jgi:protein SCO1/2
MATVAAEPRRRGPPRRAVFALGVVVAALLLALALSRSRDQGGVRVAPPGRPELALPLPPFALRTQRDEALGLSDLRGSVWTVGFMFTHCPTICPRLTRTMVELEARTRDVERLRFLSISVDPANDTPAALSAYADRMGAVTPRWIFATGDQKEIERTVLEGFKLALAKGPDGALVHAERFVLVDGAGRIRGYFDADEAGQRDLEAAARRLVGAL